MIEIRDLHYTYPGGSEKTLKGLNFKIQKGEIFGFLGPSGAGKSTTQKIMIGILKGYQGSVRINNQELKAITSDYYEKIGVAFELPNLYSKFTAYENLSFFRSLYAGQTAEPLELLGMVGLEEDAHTRVANFSKGMKMRLNFCRAFLNNPEIIFLDEPTSGLDPVNARNIKEIILKKKAEGKTIFLTTHNMNVAQDLCDQVAFIVDGQIKLIDSPRQLMVNRGVKQIRLEYREAGRIQTMDFPLQGIGANQRFLKLLQEKEVETMHTLEASLEDIFIEVTGRRLA